MAGNGLAYGQGGYRLAERPGSANQGERKANKAKAFAGVVQW